MFLHLPFVTLKFMNYSRPCSFSDCWIGTTKDWIGKWSITEWRFRRWRCKTVTDSNWWRIEHLLDFLNSAKYLQIRALTNLFLVQNCIFLTISKRVLLLCPCLSPDLRAAKSCCSQRIVSHFSSSPDWISQVVIHFLSF